ncbi:hypothetical protein MTR62_10880 [Novosphingobium sp. 1949]|uniref:Sugar transporter n=1 Tax=Novosphingobium organovorum TaxID=2930092 RepID=A0ABT0BDP8_9SPHN|nr:hypothetical protein [Novosphingobium organovorum]MCJ2183192.1 hypothetical protein [Novosphingobium organovorum]
MSGQAKAPLWYWIIALLAALWNAYGCLDFTRTVTRDSAYLAAFPTEMVAYVDSFPLWLVGCWGLGVWGGLAGSLLLLVRSGRAVMAFLLSLAGLAATTLYQALDTVPEALTHSVVDWVMTGAIWCVALGLLGFAIRMRQRGVLARGRNA